MFVPNQLLNDQERALLEDTPEECLRRVVDRGALSLDQISEGLEPRIAAVVRSLATGERVDWPPELAERDEAGRRGELTRSMADAPRPEREGRAIEVMRTILSPFPRLLHLVEQGTLSPDEALRAARTVDYALGRYPTGTRYAVP